jgi:hypothetical protein
VRAMTDREAEALGEDLRDGHNLPDEVAEWGAEAYLQWITYCLDGGW